jgi:16S rRNA (adenine(1408)-N(1))-methyltransferase
VLEAARRDPTQLFIGVDPVAEAMAASANRAHREGLTNALFVIASVEAMPDELNGVADRVTVLFPWASLLHGVVRPEAAVLRALARIARPGATLEVVINRSALPCDEQGLAERYRAAGIIVGRMQWMSQSAYRTTWGRRVTHGSNALHVVATFGQSRASPLPQCQR